MYYIYKLFERQITSYKGVCDFCDRNRITLNLSAK